MVDYNKGTGTHGTMIIRDNGSTVQFIIVNKSSPTFFSNASWSGTVNGVSVGGTYSIRGVQTVVLGTWNVGSNQTVYFNIGGTGTQGVGGPTSHSAWIARATAPQTPSPVRYINIGHDSFTMQFTGYSDGGSPIREWALHFGPNPTLGGSGNITIGSSGTSAVSVPNLATTYYAWARGRNDVGWSGWSARTSVRTLAGCLVKVGGTWKEAVAYVKVGGVWKQAIPYVKVGGVWKDAK